VKVTINGEVFGWDNTSKPLAEALALEEALHCRYVDWETDLRAGSARAVAGFVWLVWRRNGRDVPFADIVSGATEVDLGTLDITDDGEAGPTSSALEASPATGGGTSASSPKSSTSAPGKSAT
jgi:hypothetical protein